MSFYGKVFYQLENAFAKILIKNNGKDTTTAPEDVSNSSIPAIGLNSEFTLDSGNKWIKLKKGSNNYECEFYHSIPKYDDLAKNGKFVSFTKSNATGKNPTPLEPGDQIKIQNLNFDEAGHISGIENQYFKLPITELDADLNTINTNITNLQTTVNKHTTDINNNTKNIGDLDGKYDGRLDKLEAADKTINNNINDINDKIGTMSDLGLNDDDTLVKAIGNLNNKNLLLQQKSVVENLIEMIKKTNENTATITSTNFTLTGVIDNLLNELEKNNIIIDPKDIWKNN